MKQGRKPKPDLGFSFPSAYMGLINKDCGNQIPHPMSHPIRGSDVGPMSDQRGPVPLWDKPSGAHRSWPETTV